MSAWELTNVTARLVLPPGLLIVLALVGLAFMRSRMRFGAGLVLASLVALYLLSVPAVVRPLVKSLETPYSDPADDRSAGAIVVLGGGTYAGAPEYGEDTVSPETLERLRYAAHLQRRTGKPILVAGGNPAGGASTEGEQMRQVLRELGASVKWVEGKSANTFESARFSQAILRKAGIQSIYLVTHAWHMPRSQLAFERAGLSVVPAGVGYTTARGLGPLDFVPSTRALHLSYYFFHEVLGMVWYRLKFDLGR